jgi:hypothetical protein
MAHEKQLSSNYRVEVSGWDAMETFFLEKTVLYWDSAGHQLCLRARLREGAVLFVRLLQPFDNEENFPVPYVVTRNLPIEMDGRVTVSISRLHAKPSYRQSVINIESARANYA